MANQTLQLTQKRFRKGESSDASSNSIETAKKNLMELIKLAKGSIINETERTNLIDDVRSNIKMCLEEIFGDEKKVDDSGNLNVSIDYNYPQNSPYKTALIFNYWSPEGERLSTAVRQKNDCKSWIGRKNIFYKGNRWSDSEKHDLFYKFFDIIKEVFGGEAPIDFFTKHSIDSKLPQIFLTCTNSNFGDNKLNYVKLVKLPDLERCFRTQRVDYPKTVELINLIYKYRSSNLDRNIAKSVTIDTNYLADLRTSAFAELKDTDKFQEWKKEIIKYFSNEVKLTITDEQIFDMIICFQYYDHPYIIQMHFPDNTSLIEISDKDLKDDHYSYPIFNKIFYGCFVLTYHVHKKITISSELLNSLGELAGLSVLAEELIWLFHSDQLRIEAVWANHYDSRFEDYESITYLILGLCRAVGHQLGMRVFDIPTRVKSFSSFYNKIARRANGRGPADERYPQAEDISYYYTITRKEPMIRVEGTDGNGSPNIILQQEIRDWLKKIILNPTMNNANIVFGMLKDMAGVRVICALKNQEMEKALYKEFAELKEKKLLKECSFKEYDSPSGYRSFHIVFKLNESAFSNSSGKAFAEKACEIQIRSLLEQGWNDVSHLLFYKPAYPDRIHENQAVKELFRQLNGASGGLLNIDSQFQKIDKEIKSIAEVSSHDKMSE